MKVSTSPESLTIEWPTGATREYVSLWLRDNVKAQRDPQSGQRLIDIADLPGEPKIRSAELMDGVVRVQWEGESTAGEFALEWLERQGTASGALRPERSVRTWLDGASKNARSDFAWIDYPALFADSTPKLGWLTQLLQTGIAFVAGVPATEHGILEAVRPLGRVSETNYGAVFDVRSVPNPENLAYSDLGLGLHTDNPYREPVPGFQALHALTVSPDGGENVFADGFALAAHLRVAAPEDFALLTETPVPFHYRSKDADLYAERPLIELDCGGQISAVHYNNRSIAPMQVTGRAVREFYAAYRRFAQALREPSFQLRYRLNAGELVVMDNQRILHGRTAFTSARHARHLRGCYLTRDSVYSETALLRDRLAREGGVWAS
jgi:gamma-butyrobetaine dioxygenase